MKGVNTMTSVSIYLLLPYIGAVLAFVLGKINDKTAFWVAEVVGAILFITSVTVFMNYTAPIDIDYTWISYGDLRLPLGIYIDHLSIVMLLIATGLGFADIHFAHDYMGDDPDKPRYYAKVLFFIGGMILLVIAKDLIGAFAGWEFMGLASYLLISFWFKTKSASDAGMQAFLYTRFGDIFILAAIGLLMYYVGNINMIDLNQMKQNLHIRSHSYRCSLLFYPDFPCFRFFLHPWIHRFHPWLCDQW